MARTTVEVPYSATVHWLWVALVGEKKTQQNKTYQHIRFTSHLEAFRGCKWISIHFPVYKKQVVLNDLLNCWTISYNALDFPAPFQPGCLCWERGRAARSVCFHSGECGHPAAAFLSAGWCSGLLDAAWGSSQASADGRAARHGASCLFSKPLYLRLLVKLMLGEFC